MCTLIQTPTARWTASWLCGVSLAILSACGDESAYQSPAWLASAEAEERALFAELKAVDWPADGARPSVRFYEGASMSEAQDAAIWDDPVVKRAQSIGVDSMDVEDNQRAAWKSDGVGKGFYAIGEGCLKQAFLDVMENGIARWGKVSVSDSMPLSSGRSTSRSQVEGPIGGFEFDSMTTTTDESVGEDVTNMRIVHRVRMRRDGEVFAATSDLRYDSLSAGVDGDHRYKLQPESIDFADMLRRVVEWPNICFVVLSDGSWDEFRVYMHVAME